MELLLLTLKVMFMIWAINVVLSIVFYVLNVFATVFSQLKKHSLLKPTAIFIAAVTSPIWTTATAILLLTLIHAF